MPTQNDFSAIEALDLEPIKAKLMHAKGGEGWSLERASAIELEYRRFLYLMKKYPNERTSPLVDVDTFWHYHILDTKKYAADCQQVFGYFLHHFPYVGMRGKEDEEALQRMGTRMREVYEATFGEPYVRAGAASAGKTARSSGVSAGGAYGGARPRSATAAPAYCTFSLERAAYCTAPMAEAAYCTAPAAEAAYCTAPVAAAYCTAPMAEAAYCTAPVAEPAYCTFTLDAGASGPGLEYRAGFFLDRPRLPAS